MHLDVLEPPVCPVCELPAHRVRLLPALDPWVCEGCVLFFCGTTREWERYESARQQRRQLREGA